MMNVLSLLKSRTSTAGLSGVIIVDSRSTGVDISTNGNAGCMIDSTGSVFTEGSRTSSAYSLVSLSEPTSRRSRVIEICEKSWSLITWTATSTGWVADYAPLVQVKTVKDSTGAEIGYANPLLGPYYPPQPFSPSKGAMRQNGRTKMTDILDGLSNTTLFSEASGRTLQFYTDRRGVPYDATTITGPIWADSDNRLTLTGTSPDGRSAFGSGPCVMNCNNLQGDIYSFHAGGSNIGFADGSVRFVSQSITIDVLAALVTARGGENVTAPGD